MSDLPEWVQVGAQAVSYDSRHGHGRVVYVKRILPTMVVTQSRRGVEERWRRHGLSLRTSDGWSGTYLRDRDDPAMVDLFAMAARRKTRAAVVAVLDDWVKDGNPEDLEAAITRLRDYLAGGAK